MNTEISSENHLQWNKSFKYASQIEPKLPIQNPIPKVPILHGTPNTRLVDQNPSTNAFVKSSSSEVFGIEPS